MTRTKRTLPDHDEGYPMTTRVRLTRASEIPMATRAEMNAERHARHALKLAVHDEQIGPLLVYVSDLLYEADDPRAESLPSSTTLGRIRHALRSLADAPAAQHDRPRPMGRGHHPEATQSHTEPETP